MFTGYDYAFYSNNVDLCFRVSPGISLDSPELTAVLDNKDQVSHVQILYVPIFR